MLDFEATVRAQPGPAREWLARLGEIAERGDFERSYVELFAVQREAKRERPPTSFRDGDTLLEALWCPGGPDGQAVLQWFAGTIDVARYDNTRARLHLEEALAYAERSGAQQLAALIRETLAEALTWIGASYTQLSNYQEAFEHLYAALDLYTQLDALPRAGRALNYSLLIRSRRSANTSKRSHLPRPTMVQTWSGDCSPISVKATHCSINTSARSSIWTAPLPSSRR